MICLHYQDGPELDVAGHNVVTVVVDRSETKLTEAGWNRWRKGLEGPPHSHEAKEQIFYAVNRPGSNGGPVRGATRPRSLTNPANILRMFATDGCSAWGNRSNEERTPAK